MKPDRDNPQNCRQPTVVLDEIQASGGYACVYKDLRFGHWASNLSINHAVLFQIEKVWAYIFIFSRLLLHIHSFRVHVSKFFKKFTLQFAVKFHGDCLS